MNPRGRPFRRTVLIVFGIHVGLLLLFGLPMAQCHKSKPIQPVEIIDLGSLRPGPGLPSPTSFASSSHPNPTSIGNSKSRIQNPESTPPTHPNTRGAEN